LLDRVKLVVVLAVALGEALVCLVNRAAGEVVVIEHLQEAPGDGLL
jgi:hypothetical protein